MPRLMVVLEARFLRTGDDHHYAGSNYDYGFWEGYLEVFDRLTVVARSERVEAIPSGWLRADGPGVTFCCLPAYRGPLGFLRSNKEIRRALGPCLAEINSIVFRGYGIIAWLVDRMLRERHQSFPTGLEVVGDPRAALRFSSVRSPAAPFARLLFVDLLRRRCRTAQAVAYVTESALQRSYPPGPTTFTTSYSDVTLPPTYYASADELGHRLARVGGGEPEGTVPRHNRLLFVGSLAARYKGLADLLQALRILRDQGFPFLLDVLGEGRERPAMQRLAESLGLRTVTFRGAVPHAEVRAALLRADLMVLPSHTEGLPRAALEAMAVGCPILATEVGGVPEILRQEDLVPPRNPQVLARRIAELLANPAQMREAVLRNQRRALDFAPTTLQARRRSFLSHLRDLAPPTKMRPD